MHLQRSAREAAGRLKDGVWTSAQCGLAASGAWAFSTHVLGHARPFFASVAAVVALGVSGGGRLRRTAELAVGVALGVLVGDLLVGVIGQGAWQIGVVVTIALLLALGVGGTGLAVSQAGLQGVFVVVLPRAPHSGLHRWQDALVGGGAALLVAALLPANPWREVVRRRDAYVAKLAEVLRATAAGARAGDGAELAEALARGRTLEPDLAGWKQELTAGRETARLTLLRRRDPAEWERARRLAEMLTMSSRNLRVGVRRILTTVEMEQALAPALPELLDELADAVELLGDGQRAIPLLLELGGRLDPVALGATSLADQVVVGQLRVVVVDLLEALGLGRRAARAPLPELPA